MHSLMRRAWVDVDLGALLRNGTALATRANVPLLPMVKADAYGLGAERVSRTLERLDPWGFGVATVAEAEELRAQLASVHEDATLERQRLEERDRLLSGSLSEIGRASCRERVSDTV